MYKQKYSGERSHVKTLRQESKNKLGHQLRNERQTTIEKGKARLE